MDALPVGGQSGGYPLWPSVGGQHGSTGQLGIAAHKTAGEGYRQISLVLPPVGGGGLGKGDVVRLT